MADLPTQSTAAMKHTRGLDVALGGISAVLAYGGGALAFNGGWVGVVGIFGALLAGTCVVAITMRHRGKVNGPHIPSWIISVILFLVMIPLFVAYFAWKSGDAMPGMEQYVFPILGVVSVVLAVAMLLVTVSRKA